MGVDSEFFVNEPFDAGLQAIFEAVFTSGDPIIYGAAGKILVRED